MFRPKGQGDEAFSPLNHQEYEDQGGNRPKAAADWAEAGNPVRRPGCHHPLIFRR